LGTRRGRQPTLNAPASRSSERRASGGRERRSLRLRKARAHGEVATIRDVAREAGVSVATVSRVFNGTARVREATDREVRHVAHKLNYWPNGAARSLITNQTLTLGVLLPDLHGEFFSEVIRGIDLAARRTGHHLLVSSSHADTEELVAALRAMRGRIDGLIVMAPDVDGPPHIRAGAYGRPIVLLNPGRTVRGCDAISIDNVAGARDIVDHLIRLGHERIAMVTGPARNMDARLRLEGYRLALQDARLRVHPGYELAGDFSEASGFAAGRAALELESRPTALFVSNDKMAVGVLRAFSAAGVAVPDDLAVAGFDDIEISEHLDPPLTTVHADAYRLGERAVERLMRLMNNPASEGKRHEILPTTLVVRESCGSTRTPVALERVRSIESTSSGRRASHTLPPEPRR
jgi:LacI family transcriptional regulator